MKNKAATRVGTRFTSRLQTHERSVDRAPRPLTHDVAGLKQQRGREESRSYERAPKVRGVSPSPSYARRAGQGRLVVRKRGIEPPRVLPHRNLNPARLPIPPLPRVEGGEITVARRGVKVQGARGCCVKNSKRVRHPCGWRIGKLCRPAHRVRGGGSSNHMIRS